MQSDVPEMYSLQQKGNYRKSPVKPNAQIPKYVCVMTSDSCECRQWPLKAEKTYTEMFMEFCF